MGRERDRGGRHGRRSRCSPRERISAASARSVAGGCPRWVKEPDFLEGPVLLARLGARSSLSLRVYLVSPDAVAKIIRRQPWRSRLREGDSGECRRGLPYRASSEAEPALDPPAVFRVDDTRFTAPWSLQSDERYLSSSKRAMLYQMRSSRERRRKRES